MNGFGDPVPSDEHAAQACRTALTVQARLPELRPLLGFLGAELPNVVVEVRDLQVRVELGADPMADELPNHAEALLVGVGLDGPTVARSQF